MQLDPVTLSVCLSLSYVVSAVVFAMLWVATPTDVALRDLAIGFGAVTAGVLLLGINGGAANRPMLAISNILLVAGLAVVWRGVRRFFGRPLPDAIPAAIAAAYAVAFAILVYTDAGVRSRVLLSSATLSIFTAIVSVETIVLHRSPQEPAHASDLRAGRLMTAFGFAIYALPQAFRAALAVFDPATPSPFARDNLNAVLVFLLPIAGTLFTTFGLFLLNYLRIIAEKEFGASHDPLTGKLNRRALAARAQAQMQQADRHGYPVACLMVDIDHFKRINDTWGHAAGDAVIVAVAEMIAGTLRAGDLLARFGGEEFCILCPHMTPEGARALAERVRRTVADAAPVPPLDTAVTVSVGAALAVPGRDACEGWEAVARQADEALYVAKRAGRNRAEMFVPA